MNNLLGTINITIQYDSSKYENIKAWWFNESASGGNGTWEEVPISIEGNEITFSVNHASIYALSGTEINGGILNGDDGGGGGDDDDDVGGVGDYLLLYVVLSVIGISGAVGGLLYYGVKKQYILSEFRSKPKKAEKPKRSKEKSLDNEIIKEFKFCPFCNKKIDKSLDRCSYCDVPFKDFKESS